MSDLFTMSEKSTIIDNFTSSAFVRHPFVRLVSGFIDKIVDNDYKNWRKLVMYSEKDKFKVNYMGLLMESSIPGEICSGKILKSETNGAIKKSYQYHSNIGYGLK